MNWSVSHGGGVVTVRLPMLYYARSTGQSYSYSNWHPHQILARDPALLFREYGRFRQILADGITGTTGWPGRREDLDAAHGRGQLPLVGGDRRLHLRSELGLPRLVRQEDRLRLLSQEAPQLRDECRAGALGRGRVRSLADRNHRVPPAVHLPDPGPPQEAPEVPRIRKGVTQQRAELEPDEWELRPLDDPLLLPILRVPHLDVGPHPVRGARRRTPGAVRGPQHRIVLLHQALEPSHEVAGDAVPIRRGLCDADPDDGVTPRIPLPDPVQAERGPKRPTIREGIEENGLQLHPDERELAPVQAEGQEVGAPEEHDDPERGDTSGEKGGDLTRPLYIWLFDFFRVGFKGV